MTGQVLVASEARAPVSTKLSEERWSRFLARTVASDDAISLPFHRAGHELVVVRIRYDAVSLTDTGNDQRVGP